MLFQTADVLAQYIKSTYSSTTSPGSSISLANFSGGGALNPGIYTLYGQIYFSTGGTAPVDGTDSDNFSLSIDNISTGRILVPASAGLVIPFTFIGVNTITGNIAIKTVNAGTTGTIYRTSLSAFWS
jgi:hypothetical protein